jgi:hypothetical protein
MVAVAAPKPADPGEDEAMMMVFLAARAVGGVAGGAVGIGALYVLHFVFPEVEIRDETGPVG